MSHPGFSFFHGSAWAKVLKDTYGFTPYYFAAARDAQLLGLLPIMEVRSWLSGVRGVSLPFTDECGPLTSETASVSNLCTAALELGKTRQWKYWECRNGSGLFGGLPESVCFHGHKLWLSKTEDGLFGQLEGSVRRAIKKAARSGITVDLSCRPQAVETFYTLHCRTRRKHGLPPQPYSFFERIHQHVLVQGQGFVALASLGKLPVAAAIFFHMGTKAVYKFGASDERLQHLRGSNLVMWESIKWLTRSGFTELNFGRTSVSNEGLRKFKLGWGAEEYRLAYSKFDFPKRAFVKDIDQAFGWYNQLFALLPTPVSRWAGAFLYRHIA